MTFTLARLAIMATVAQASNLHFSYSLPWDRECDRCEKSAQAAFFLVWLSSLISFIPFYQLVLFSCPLDRKR